MTRPRYFSYLLILLSFVLAFNLTAYTTAPLTATVSPTPFIFKTGTSAPTRTRVPTITRTPTITLTPTPAVQADADPLVWLDADIQLDHFSPIGTLVIHFNTPMLPNSSANPVLTWPDAPNTITWNADNTTLTFRPNTMLDAKKTYTFFLDPNLQAANGKKLKESAEWVVYPQEGVRIVSVSPPAGQMTLLKSQIIVSFDREMDRALSESVFSIEPALPFEIGWKSTKTLEITLGEALQPGERYDLVLKPLTAADGTRLTEDYHWFYTVPVLEAELTVSGKTLRVEFSRNVDQEKTGLPFSISPALEGTWAWEKNDSRTAIFTSSELISAASQYTLSFTAPIVENDGTLSNPPSRTFTGEVPIYVLGEMKNDNDPIDINTDQEEFTVHFDVLVDHASAEQAFSFNPSVKGTFSWDTKDVEENLVFTIDELLQPSTYSTPTIYTLKIDKTIKDRQGKLLLSTPYQQQFRTSYYDRQSISFGEDGENIQVVDASGPRKLQIQGSEDEDALSFAAYRFDLIDYAKLYANYYHDRRGTNLYDIPIPEGLKATAIWSGLTKRLINNDFGDDFSINETTLPDTLTPGLYILNMRIRGALYDQLFLVVTRNTLVVKRDGENLFVWLTDINGGDVPEAEIRVYSETGEKIREGKTDAEGQYRVSIPPGAEPMLVSARTREKNLQEDVTLSGFDGWRRYAQYNYDKYYEYAAQTNLRQGLPYLLYTYTERPIYRPGQQVNFKAVVRKDHDIRYELPPTNTLVKVTVEDGRGNQVETFDLRTNQFGTVNGAFTLTDGAMLGDYSITTEVDGVSDSYDFKVEDYRKPDYQITITSLQPEKNNRFIDGEEIQIKVNVSYYFGEPVANTVLSAKFYDAGNLDANKYMKSRLVTDANGDAIVTFKAPYTTEYYYYYYYRADHYTQLEISANDGSNQVVASVYGFHVFPAAEKLSLDMGGYYFAPDKPIKITARAVDLDDKPVIDRKLTLTLERWNRETYDFETMENVYHLQTDAQGYATIDVLLSSDYYQLVLKGEDAAGNDTKATNGIYVFKNSNDWFARSRSEHLSISAEKETYKPYEKARFMVESSFSGLALLTFERGSVINTKQVQLTAPLTIVETDVIPEHAPNVFVLINAWDTANLPEYGFSSISDSALRVARTQINVDTSEKALDLTIETDKKAYAPGEQVTTTIQVKDSNGQPVLAELSLAVVDESIFALASDTSGEIFEAFYGPRLHDVETFNSMSPSRYLTPMLGGGGGEAAPEPSVRSDFLDTSAWFPTLQTDVSGRVTATFNLPDNTTSWRLSVRAITLDHKVGRAEANVETKKQVFLRPSLPRVLTSGDQATLTAFVHNYGETARTVSVSFAAAGLDVQGQTEQQITLQPGDVQPVGWRVHVSGATPTEVTLAVTGAEGPLDVVRVPLLIQPSAIKDLQNQSGLVQGSLTLGLPVPLIERRTSQARLSLNRSMAGTILNGLEYLTGYPYGCVEQTMSRAMPNAVVSRAAGQLGIGGPALQEKVAPLVKASIQRLYGLQHHDGAWGWWTDDRSDAYQTAWVLYGLSLMEQSGHTVDQDVMNHAAEWLKKENGYYSAKTKDELRTLAYILFSLAEAGRGAKDDTIALAEHDLDQLDTFSQAALALALARLDEKEKAQAIMDSISQNAIHNGSEVSWPQSSEDGEYHAKTMSSTLRTTALVLLAYMRIEPQNKLIPGIVTYLAAQRQGIYGWGTTNETSYTILALTEYLKVQEEAAGAVQYEVLVNGKSLAQGTLAAGEPTASLDIPMTELNDGTNSVIITTQGDQPLYYDLSTRYDLLQTSTRAAGKIQVERLYLDPTTNRPLTELTPGQLVKVRLEVDAPQTTSFVAVEDYLPGGLEALNEGLNAVTVGAGYSDYDYWDYMQYYWEDYGYNYKEIRGDRVVFFVTTLYQELHVFTYYARVTTPGEFTILPTQVYAMYDVSMWGRSDGGKMVVK